MQTAHSVQEINQLLDELEVSGQSVAAFARDRKVPAHRLYWARRRRGRESSAETFDEVHVVDDSREIGTPIDLQLPTGHSIRVTRDFDEVALRRLLGVLRSC